MVSEPADPLVPRYVGDTLHWLGRDLDDLAIRLGTPSYLFSEEVLRTQVRRLQGAIRAQGTDPVLRYPAKANPDPRILACLAATEIGLLAAHPGEVEAGLEAGFPPAAIAYQRPVLEDEHLDRVLGLGVRFVHATRDGDVERIARRARGLRESVRVSVRLRPPAAMLLRGPSVPLGVSLSSLPALLKRTRETPGVRAAGVSVYLGSQQASPRRFARFVRRLAAILPADLPEHFEIDLGGGIPSPSLARTLFGSLLGRLWERPEPPAGIDPGSFAGTVARAFVAAFADESRPQPTLALEPGRPLVGPSGILLATVRADDGRWLLLDAGRNGLAESPLFRRRTLLPLVRKAGEPLSRRHVGGPRLDSRDVVDLFRRLPPLAPGDRLAILDAGAYTLSRATAYAGPPPRAYLLEGAGGDLPRAAGLPEARPAGVST